MKNSKFRNVYGRTFLNDGIRAASENSHHIISARMAVAPSVPAGVFFLRLESAPPIFKKAGSKIAVGVSNVFDFFLS